ncbi:hypothetical protein DNFV4_00119 [Nitrospira tepida]|uniref:Uncharacterized protein n=1 Tax=Nitrospira tepida TaxID=2973512 RepID=A0AA86MVC8_9BACT|nr:hypothetical protein DNFV4_00119 [Nitrospira tepida]
MFIMGLLALLMHPAGLILAAMVLIGKDLTRLLLGAD